ERSTLGGWIATGATGLQGLRYGAIDALFAGGTVRSGDGEMHFPPDPDGATRQQLLGSRGRRGIITQAVVRVVPRPALDHTFGMYFRDEAQLLAAARDLAESGITIAMMRAGTAPDTAML